MDNNNQVFNEVPGTELDVNAVNIEKWLTRDLDTAIALLTALRRNVNLKSQLAIWMNGEIQNFKNKPDPAQTEMFAKR